MNVTGASRRRHEADPAPHLPVRGSGGRSLRLDPKWTHVLAETASQVSVDGSHAVVVYDTFPPGSGFENEYDLDTPVEAPVQRLARVGCAAIVLESWRDHVSLRLRRARTRKHEHDERRHRGHDARKAEGRAATASGRRRSHARSLTATAGSRRRR